MVHALRWMVPAMFVIGSLAINSPPLIESQCSDDESWLAYWRTGGNDFAPAAAQRYPAYVGRALMLLQGNAHFGQHQVLVLLIMSFATFAEGVVIPDVENADALHAFRYAQGAHMTRLFDKLDGGLPVTVAAIGSSTTANGGAMFCSSHTVPMARGVNPDELRPAAAGASLDDEAYCSPRLCDPTYWKSWPWLVMFMCDLNRTWPHPEHLLVNLARSGTGLNLHMTTRCLHGLLPRAPLDLMIADFSTHPSTPVEMERFVRLLLSLRQPHPPVILLFHHYNFRNCMPERFDASLVNFADDSAGEVRHRFELLALPIEYGADTKRRATLLQRAGSPLAEVGVTADRRVGEGRGQPANARLVSQEEKLLMDGPNKHALGSPCHLAHIPDVHRYTLLERYYGLAHISEADYFSSLLQSQPHIRRAELMAALAASPTDGLHQNNRWLRLQTQLLTAWLSAWPRSVGVRPKASTARLSRSMPVPVPLFAGSLSEYNASARGSRVARCIVVGARGRMDFDDLLVSYRGFTWTDRYAPDPLHPQVTKSKPGWQAKEAGAQLALDLTAAWQRFLAEPLPKIFSVSLTSLTSYKDMGRARFSCSGECSCDAKVFDGHSKEHISVAAAVSIGEVRANREGAICWLNATALGGGRVQLDYVTLQETRRRDLASGFKFKRSGELDPPLDVEH
jgi:hypothetical protein